eukprot:Tamp_05181.p1 GENE.Tamp_05181~~Tamp_05181.p1  ORF type:complete len:661 (+),score=38.00 Tamp_05181:313-2295(+)
MRGFRRFMVILIAWVCMLPVLWQRLRASVEDKRHLMVRNQTVDPTRVLNDAIKTRATSSTNMGSFLSVEHRLTPDPGSQRCVAALRLIVLTMDRHHSLLRLLVSLQKADYGRDCIDLDVWIDRTTAGLLHSPTKLVADEVNWPFGRKVVHVRSENAGLRGQWLDTWNLSIPGGLQPTTAERALICEDDIEVSPHFWKWLKTGHTRYSNRNDVAGFTLQRAELCLRGCANLQGGPVQDGTNFVYSLVGSWGFSPKPQHWIKFTSWARKFIVNEKMTKPYVDGIVTTSWYKSFEGKRRCPGKNCMWTQLHIKYTSLFPDKYTVYAKCSNGLSLASNHREAGLHYSEKMGRESSLVRDFLEPSLLNFPDPPYIVSWDGHLHKPNSLPNAVVATWSNVVDAAVQLHANQTCQKALGWTPLMIVNEHFLVLLKNWLQLTPQKLSGWGHTICACTLFVAIDGSSMEFISRNVSLPWVTRWTDSSGPGTELKYGSHKYFELMSSRLRLVQDILLRGVNVALIEADQVLLKDPFRIVNFLESQKMHDFIAYDDSKDQNTRLPCFGFLFIRSNSASQEVWNKLIKKMEAKPQNEQILMQQLMQHDNTVSFRFLPSMQFRNGVLFGGNGGVFKRPAHRENSSNLAMVHANWVIGIENKILMLRYHGWWKQ